MFFQPDDSLEDSREATPDSDSGYVISNIKKDSLSVGSKPAFQAHTKVEPEAPFIEKQVESQTVPHIHSRLFLEKG